MLYGSANEAKESAINVLLDVVIKSQDKDAGVESKDSQSLHPVLNGLLTFHL